ncbi:hypothetical protein FCL40_08705 [Ferrimonas sediminicola]|uniref:ChrR-like cupin domain-containing protein n=1 Tax=Ferrimonas sediminicola TaxID=2569538 RepID=A0A4U1BEC0_9GAMM|nr:ChrR family anti-sigma-E factor [Ferrimonas sediminicola]TKB49402.1 hypothetical protein FCL40_08705 [Ferrimonas sediminicola]
MSDRHHPTAMELGQFASGELDDVLAIMVSVHLGQCRRCHGRVELLQQHQADQLAELSPDAAYGNDELARMLNLLEDAPALEPRVPEPTQMEFQGRRIDLPAALAGLVERAGPWSRVVNRLWNAPIQDHRRAYQLNFIYMEPGGSIAAHTHKGREWTLVLDGHFSDDAGDYAPGDLVHCTEANEHSPRSEQGCLCLAVIDAPLHFTSGLARALNPFSQLFFKTGG